MARKLRLQVNDWVMHRATKTFGFVYDVSLNLPKDYAQWGLYEYRIAWQGQHTLQLNDWTISDLSHGLIVAIDNPNSIKVLYGIHKG